MQEDNGVKLIDPMGEMLAQTWEGYATLVANAEEEDLVAALKEVIEKEEINMNQEANVLVGRDTRYVHEVQRSFIDNTTKRAHWSFVAWHLLASDEEESRKKKLVQIMNDGPKHKLKCLLYS